MTRTHAVVVLTGLLSVGGCRPNEPPPSPPSVVVQHPLGSSGVTLDPSIAAICEIDAYAVFEQRPSETPDATAEALEAVARCASDGPLTGRQLEAVAYGGPGTDDLYRERFGESRAETLRRILVRDGLEPEAIDARTTTVADDAPAGDREWPRDRVVELRVLTKPTF